MKLTDLEGNPSVFREAHLRDYWKVVWHGRWTGLAVFTFVIVATVVWTMLQTPVYRATATVEVQPKARRLAAGQDVSGLGAAGYGWFAEEKYHNTQIEIIQSRDVAKRVVNELGLRSDPEFAESSDPVELLRQRIQVVPRRDTGLIEVSITGTDPERITELVNAVAASYVERNLERAEANVALAIGTIKTQMIELEEEFMVADQKRFEELENSSIFGSEEQVEIVRDKLKKFNAELTDVQLELSRLRDNLQRIEQSRGDVTSLLSLPALAEDPTLKELMTTKVELDRELASAKVDLRPDHPVYEKALSELAKVEQRIDEQIGFILTTLRTRYDLAIENEKYLQQQITVAEDVSLAVARATSTYGVAKSQAETKKGILDVIARTVSEVEFGQRLMENNVTVLDDAIPPRYPIKPRRKLNLGIAMMLGSFLGIASAFFLDYLDNTFRTPEDIEKHLGVAVLGVIPKAQQEEGLANRGVREAFQSLRTSVIFSSKNRQRKVILISSTGPQEGKSTTVANLGRMLASGGDRVVILDCDMRRPTQHFLHELDRDHGLTNYLTAPLDRTDWTSYAKAVTPAGLRIFTCGPIPPSPPELIGSERFASLLDRLRESFDWVLIDSPPSSSLADAPLLASMADMLVLIVQHNRTDRDLVRKTLQRLRSVNKNIAGAVLNNVDMERAYDKDYYYAGYYYLEDGGEKRRTKVRKRRGDQPKVNVG